MAEFLQDISKDGEIVLENGRVKLAKYVSEKEKNGLGLKMNFPKNIDKDKKEEETLPGLENEISREIEQLNLQVSTIWNTYTQLSLIKDTSWIAWKNKKHPIVNPKYWRNVRKHYSRNLENKKQPF